MSNNLSAPSDGRPTRKDVAELAQVSGATVSRVLSGRADLSVSPKARQRVLQAARDLGYSPNSAAQALRSGRTGLVGFWMCLEYSRYRGEVLDRMRTLLRPTDYTLAVTDVDEEVAWHHSLARALRVPVDGIIAFDASLAADAFAENSAQLAPTLPFVSMGAYWSEAKSYVGIDLKAGAEEAVAHLLATGRQKIAYLAPHESGFVTEGARYEGYREKMVEAGREPFSYEVTTSVSDRIEDLKSLFARLRDAGQLPEAIFCMFDDIAVDAVPALLELGLTPGKDVAVVGFNGTEGTERGPWPITTVRQPVEEMCVLAVEYLRAQMDDPSAPPRQTVLKPELVVRATSS